MNQTYPRLGIPNVDPAQPTDYGAGRGFLPFPEQEKIGWVSSCSSQTSFQIIAFPAASEIVKLPIPIPPDDFPRRSQPPLPGNRD